MLSVRWSLLLLSAVLKPTTWCLYLLYGFKIKGVSIKMNHVQFKIKPCQQNVHILLYTFVALFESWWENWITWDLEVGSQVLFFVAVITDDHTVAV